MKRLVSIFVVLLLFLTSCKQDVVKQENITKEPSQKAPIVKETAVSSLKNKTVNINKIGTSVFSKVPSKSYRTIIYMYENKVIYYNDPKEEPTKDYMNQLFYCFDMGTKTTKFITEIPDFNTSFEDAVFRKGKIYYPYSQPTKDLILEIDLNNLKSRLIDCEKALIPAIFLNSVDTGILRIFQKLNDKKEVEYLINHIDVDNKDKVTPIIKVKDNNSNGEIMTYAATTYDRIYSYILNLNNSQEKSYIREHKIDGMKIKDYDLGDLKNFFYSSPNREDGYSGGVFTLFKAKDYFIMHTINNRNLIYKKNNNEMERIDVPEDLDGFENGANPILQKDRVEKYVYFFHAGIKQQLTVFNMDDGTFNKLTLEFDNKNYINDAVSDSKGNLIITLYNDTSNDGSSDNLFYNYYYIPVEKITELINSK